MWCRIPLIVYVLLFAGCGKDSEEDNGSSLDLSSYEGIWVGGCDDARPDSKITYSIHANATFASIVTTYTTEKCGESGEETQIEQSVGRITSVGDSDSAEGSTALYVSVDKNTYTPRSESTAKQWNTNQFCGSTSWATNQPQGFDESEVGTHQHGDCWKSSRAINHTLAGDEFEDLLPDDSTMTLNRTSTTSWVSGLVNNRPFVGSTGIVKLAPGDSGEYWYEIHSNYLLSPCSYFIPPTRAKLIFSLDPSATEVSLSNTNTATFSFDSNNLITTEGSITIASAPGDTASGSLAMEFDGENSVSGAFEATSCLETE